MDKLIFVVILFVLAAQAISSGPDDVLGLWKTNGDRSRIELYRCGDKICGKVVWLREPKFIRSKDGPVGEVKIDLRNPDAALQKRPILGLQVIEGLMYAGDNTWENGICYDPQSGNSYKCTMWFVAPDRIDLHGYIGFSFIGRTYTLQRFMETSNGHVSSGKDRGKMGHIKQ
jgi:uncharacterized protein (DUF2147 family)